MNARRIALGLAAGAALALGLLTIAAASDQTVDVVVYVSSSSSGTVDGIEFKDEDILAYNTETDAWAMHFDGSDLGLNADDINAFQILDDLNAATLDPILVSVKNANLPGLAIDDSDIAIFTPTSLGDTTAGAFEMYFDGSDVDLSSNSEQIDAIALTPDGKLVISTNGSTRVPKTGGGTLRADDEDLLVFTGTTGATTSGTFELYFDGSDVGLTAANEDIWGAWVDPFTDDLYITTKDEFSVPGSPVDPLVGDQEDIILFSGTRGPSTSGTFADYWDGDVHRLAGQRLDGFSIEFLNAPPELDPIGDQTVDELTTLAFTATASDPDLPPDTLTWSLDLASLAEGMTINSTNGDFGWTPTEAQGPGVFTVTITVTDDGTPSLSDAETFDITVDEVNEAPVLDAVGDKSIDEGSLLSFTASASDPDVPANGLTFSLDAGAPAGASITSTGEFSWTPTEAQGPGSFSVTVRVTDDGSPVLDDFETISITVDEVNEAPVLDAVGDKSIDEGSLLSFTASASDPDLPANGLTFSLDAGAPAGASITSTGEFSWTPTEAQGPGSFSVTVRVTDDGSPVLDDFETISITVDEVNEAPVLDAVGDKSIDEGSLLSFTASASDPDLPANGLTFSLDAGAPAGASITSTGEFSWTPTEAQGPGSFSVTVRVTDDGSPVLDDFETISITVDEVNEAPVLDAVGDKSIDEGLLLSFTASASDPDLPANGLTFSLDAGAPAGASITSTGEFSWTPTEAQGPGSFSVTVRVTDDGSPVLDDFETISITVDEVNEAPTITSSASQTIDENLTAVGTLTATDSDVPVQTLTWSKTGGGADQALLSISTGGDLSFISPPDFETPADFDGDNFYEVEVQVSDGVVATTQLVTVEVVDVVVENLAPVLAPDAFTASFTEDGGPVAIAGAITVSDGDDTDLVSATVSITNLQDAGDEVLAANTGGTGITAIYAAPTLTLSGTDTVANYESVLQSVTYENTSDDPTASPARTIEIDVDDGTDPGNTAVSVVSVTPVNDPPDVTPTSLSYNALGNVGIDVPVGDGLLGSLIITDVDSAGPFTIQNVTATTGTLNVASDGSFTYDPVAGFVGSDDFTYDVCDNGSPLPSACTTVPVSLTVVDLIWFIDNTAGGSGGTGTLADPFKTIGDFNIAAGPGVGDDIYLAHTGTAYADGIVLKNDQQLIGEGTSDSDLQGATGVSVPLFTPTLPSINGLNPLISTTVVGVDLAAGNTVRGLDVSTSGATGISGGSVGALNLNDVDTVTTSGARALDLSGGSATMSVDIGSVTATGSSVGGINLASNAGSTTTFGSVALTTTGGTSFNVDNSGTVNITNTTSTISSTAGTSLSAVDTTIGGGGWTFASINNDQGASAGDTSAIILTNTGAGTFTVNGGTIENITDVDGIRLSNTDGLVTLANMIIEDVSASGDASADFDTRSGVDGIHGQNVDGGLTLDATTMRRFSDNAINGALFSDGLGATVWDGLSILDGSVLEDSNRYHITSPAPGKGDSSDEGLVRIVGIKGTVVIDDSTLRRGAELIDFFTTTTGSLDMTVQKSFFIDSIKEFACSGASKVNTGKAGIDVTFMGADGVVRIGDPAETNSALGNTFTNNATASLRIGHNGPTTTGNADVVISQNTFEVTDHLTGPAGCPEGNFQFNHAQGGVLLRPFGNASMEAIVSNNLFDQVMNADGGLGQLTLIGDTNSTSEFIVRGNNFKEPYNGPVSIRADGNASMQVKFGGAGDTNTYTDGLINGAGTDLGAGSFQTPYLPFLVNVRNGGSLDLTIDDEILPQHDDVLSPFSESFDASINSSGGTLNLSITDSASPDGYKLAQNGGTFNLFATAGCGGGPTPAAIIDANNNTGGGNSDITDPPTVVTSGTITCSTTAPTLPSITIP